MKKILSVIILITAIIFVSGQEKVFAYDVYCGTYSDGNAAYLMTETVSGVFYDFTCRVKAVKNRAVTYINYRFQWTGGKSFPTFTNSQGFSGRVDETVPVTSKIYSEAGKFFDF